VTPKLEAANAEARQLATLTLQELRVRWCGLYGLPCPKLRSADLLRRLLAWRLQAEVEGGLTKETRRILLSKTRAKAPGPILTPGVRLSREWRGRVCDVEVVGDGFLYEGKPYDSLSEVARKITGVRWNGPRFFGLRKEAAL
jgi:hypothetical protein